MGRTPKDDMTGREIEVVRVRPGEEVGANAGVRGRAAGTLWRIYSRSRIAVSTVDEWVEWVESCAGGTAVPRRVQKEYARKQPLRPCPRSQEKAARVYLEVL